VIKAPDGIEKSKSSLLTSLVVPKKFPFYSLTLIPLLLISRVSDAWRHLRDSFPMVERMI
jgi:hypothetical protein